MQGRQTFVTHHIPHQWAKGQFRVPFSKETGGTSPSGKGTVPKAPLPPVPGSALSTKESWRGYKPIAREEQGSAARSHYRCFPANAEQPDVAHARAQFFREDRFDQCLGSTKYTPLTNTVTRRPVRDHCINTRIPLDR